MTYAKVRLTVLFSCLALIGSRGVFGALGDCTYYDGVFEHTTNETEEGPGKRCVNMAYCEDLGACEHDEDLDIWEVYTDRIQVGDCAASGELPTWCKTCPWDVYFADQWRQVNRVCAVGWYYATEEDCDLDQNPVGPLESGVIGGCTGTVIY